MLGERGGSRHNLPLLSAAPPLMIRATMTAAVASSLLMVAPWGVGTHAVCDENPICVILDCTIFYFGKRQH